MTKKVSATDAPDRADCRGPSSFRRVLLVSGLVLLAANLRPAITSVAPLIGEIRADTGVSNGVAGLLTTLPLLAFGVLSPIAPRLARVFDVVRADGQVVLSAAP